MRLAVVVLRAVISLSIFFGGVVTVKHGSAGAGGLTRRRLEPNFEKKRTRLAAVFAAAYR
jgi:hypothetical protein